MHSRFCRGLQRSIRTTIAGTTKKRDRTSRRLFRRLALPQEAAEQLALALARDQLDVADELCAALAALQHDLAAVEGFQLDAMRDADDGGLGSSSVIIFIILSWLFSSS